MIRQRSMSCGLVLLVVLPLVQSVSPIWRTPPLRYQRQPQAGQLFPPRPYYTRPEDFSIPDYSPPKPGPIRSFVPPSILHRGPSFGSFPHPLPAAPPADRPLSSLNPTLSSLNKNLISNRVFSPNVPGNHPTPIAGPIPPSGISSVQSSDGTLSSNIPGSGITKSAFSYSPSSIPSQHIISSSHSFNPYDSQYETVDASSSRPPLDYGNSVSISASRQSKKSSFRPRAETIISVQPPGGGYGDEIEEARMPTTISSRPSRPLPSTERHPSGRDEGDSFPHFNSFNPKDETTVTFYESVERTTEKGNKKSEKEVSALSTPGYSPSPSYSSSTPLIMASPTTSPTTAIPRHPFENAITSFSAPLNPYDSVPSSPQQLGKIAEENGMHPATTTTSLPTSSFTSPSAIPGYGSTTTSKMKPSVNTNVPSSPHLPSLSSPPSPYDLPSSPDSHGSSSPSPSSQLNPFSGLGYGEEIQETTTPQSTSTTARPFSDTEERHPPGRDEGDSFPHFISNTVAPETRSPVEVSMNVSRSTTTPQTLLSLSWASTPSSPAAPAVSVYSPRRGGGARFIISKESRNATLRPPSPSALPPSVNPHVFFSPSPMSTLPQQSPYESPPTPAMDSFSPPPLPPNTTELSSTTPRSPLPNRLKGKPNIACLEEGVEVSLMTLFPFTGNILAEKGGERVCLHSLSNEENARVRLSYEECGERVTHPAPLQAPFHVQVIVEIVDSETSSFSIICEQQKTLYDKKKLPTRIEESLEELRLIPMKLQQKAPLPDVEMRLTEENNENAVEIGSPQNMNVKLLNESDAYGLLLHKCFVLDEKNGERHEVIDGRGCATDMHAFAHPYYDTYHDTVQSHWHAFKLPDHTNITVQCDVSVCPAMPSSEPGNASHCGLLPTPPMCARVLPSERESIVSSARKRDVSSPPDQNLLVYASYRMTGPDVVSPRRCLKPTSLIIVLPLSLTTASLLIALVLHILSRQLCFKRT